MHEPLPYSAEKKMHILDRLAWSELFEGALLYLLLSVDLTLCCLSTPDRALFAGFGACNPLHTLLMCQGSWQTSMQQQSGSGWRAARR